MRFKFIHPSIIDLYISSLTLHLLQEKLGEMGSEKLSDKMRNDVNEASEKFANSAHVAEELFGSPDIVQEQLNRFTELMGES
jgi:hypothetical protein